MELQLRKMKFIGNKETFIVASDEYLEELDAAMIAMVKKDSEGRLTTSDAKEFTPEIGIIGLGNVGRSVAIDTELMKLKERVVVTVGPDSFAQTDKDITDKFIEHISRPSLRDIPLAPYPGEFSQNDTEKALSKKKWKEMTYEERKRFKK